MQWNLRMVAAQRGIWRASELRRLLADAGLRAKMGMAARDAAASRHGAVNTTLELVGRFLRPEIAR